MDPKDIFHVYRLTHTPDGGMHRQLAGRFAFMPDGDVAVLEDYFGLLGSLDGPVDERKQRFIASLGHSAYTEVCRAGDLQDGSRPEMLPEVQLGPASGNAIEGAPVAPGAIPTPPPVWDYHRPGMEAPACLEWHRPTGRALLNGQTLSEEELTQLLQNLEDGTATLRYRGTSALPGVAKMEAALVGAQPLEKVEDLFGVLQKLKSMVGSGALRPEELQALHQGLYEDPMVPAVGNKRAYKDFLTRPREGVHVMMDANRFKAINDDLGHEVGDKAIAALGGAMRSAMDETVGRKDGKLFRFGGDEFAAHLPTYEHAAHFGRALRARLEAIPALAGTHRLSVSMGLGHNPETADQALQHAKGAAHAAAPHHEAVHAHSLVPGQEGAIPGRSAVPTVTDTKARPHEEAPHVSVLAAPPEPTPQG